MTRHVNADQRRALYEPLADGVLRCRPPKAFGWEKRDPEPRLHARRRLAGRLGLRHGRLSNAYGAAAARVRLRADGQVRVQIAAQDVGTGAYTVIGAAGRRDGWASPMDKVTVELGDSRPCRPARSPAARSPRPAACSAVKMACDAIRAPCSPATGRRDSCRRRRTA